MDVIHRGVDATLDVSRVVRNVQEAVLLASFTEHLCSVECLVGRDRLFERIDTWLHFDADRGDRKRVGTLRVDDVRRGVELKD